MEVIKREFHNREHLINAYSWGKFQEELFSDLDREFYGSPAPVREAKGWKNGIFIVRFITVSLKERIHIMTA